MTVILKFQITREGTKYESYRMSFPKKIVEMYDLRDTLFELKIINKKLVLTPLKNKKVNH